MISDVSPDSHWISFPYNVWLFQVEVEVLVFDMSGQQLAKEKVTVWQSIKRMADTYLRPQQAEQGKSIKLAVPQSQQYQFSAKVLEVKTR